MEQIIVIIFFHQDHLLHKNKEGRRKGAWPTIGIERSPAGDIYSLASCSAGEDVQGWCAWPWRVPVSRSSAPGFLRQRPGVLWLLCGPF